MTISENQKFIIKTNELSIAYFDSIDQNSIIYVQDEYEKEYVKRIEGEFLTIYPKQYYYIKNVLYSSETPSIFQRYLFPLDLSQKEIYIENNEISQLYLVKNKIFNLNFLYNSVTKIITLSRKTLDSKIIINKDKEKFELNRNNLYYKIPSDFRGKLILQTNEYDAFIQFLSSPDENENHGFILAKSSFDNYKIDFMKSTLYIPYTQKEIDIQLLFLKMEVDINYIMNYKPKDGFVGDTMPYYENGTFYIFFLKEQGNSYNHSIFLVETKDFLNYEEKGEIADIAAKNDVDVISLIAPTSKERIQMIASDATGFIYVVSSLGVTGMRSEIKTDLNAILSDIRDVTDLPLAVGFGINTPEQASNIGKIADGVIVGSAIVKIIEEHGDYAEDALKEYVSSMKKACNE
jgi:hypothetical protein